MTSRRTATGAATATVTVSASTLTIEHLALRDAELAAFVGDHDEEARGALVESGLRLGLLALRSTGVTVNVDYIQKEFERLLRQTDESHQKAAEEVERQFRGAFADDDGKLPRTLERFLGDKGSFRRFVDDLFDDNRRDSAIGKMRTVLAGYFDGDGGTVARMLDPRRDDSPLHGFRAEVREQLKELAEQLVRLEAGREARVEERAKGTAKGLDFEDEVEARLEVIARGCGDVVEAVGRVAGDGIRCRKGDFVQTLNPSWARGLPVRVAIEAKSGPVGLLKICRELDEARVNRAAAVAVAVFAAGCAPTGCAPFTLHGEHVICEIDVDDLDDRALEAAIRLARALALAASREQSGELDVAAVHRHLDEARAHLKAVTSMKSRLTSIGTVAGEVSTSLGEMRLRVLDCVSGIEAEVAGQDAGTSHLDVA
jgi:hypothetical protein